MEHKTLRDIIEIPDPALKERLLELLWNRNPEYGTIYENYWKDKDEDEIYFIDILQVRDLIVPEECVFIEGLQYAENLKELYADNTYLYDPQLILYLDNLVKLSFRYATLDCYIDFYREMEKLEVVDFLGVNTKRKQHQARRNELGQQKTIKKS